MDNLNKLKEQAPRTNEPVRRVVIDQPIENASEFNLLGVGSPKNTTDSLLAHVYDKRNDFIEGLDPSLDPREPTPVPLPFGHPDAHRINRLIIKHERNTGI